MKILHIIGGSHKGGAYKGASILHHSLLKFGIESKIINDKNFYNNSENEINIFNENSLKKILNIFYIYFEKFIKFIFLKSPRSIFTIGIFGFDITKTKEYKEADIIHIHWLSEGFISFKSISKIKKPLVWTLRDEWLFLGGPHYSIDFKNIEENYLSKYLIKFKKKKINPNINFVAISEWLKKRAEKSYILKNFKIRKILNNIKLEDFKLLDKNKAKSYLNISTNKNILLLGALNPQSDRKGWKIINEIFKKIDKSKYFCLIYGNFWSDNIFQQTGIEYKSLGFIDDKIKLNNIYACADIFLSPSLEEAFGKTSAEAISCNTPVVCFKNTGTSEFIKHKYNGYLVDDFDSEMFLNGIYWLEKNKEQIDKNKIFDSLDDIESINIAKKYIDLYNSLI